VPYLSNDSELSGIYFWGVDCEQGYVIENDNIMIPHLKRKTQLSQSLYDDNFFLSADNEI
jgi:hypothetical protein